MIIKTPSRLHMALIDMNGSYGRMDGGIGLTINQPNFILKGEPSENKGITVDFNDEIHTDIKQECLNKIELSARKIIEYYNLDEGFDFEVEKAYFTHAGLGSGTQMALGTAKLITAYFGLEEPSVKLATIVGRGGTSGIGTFSFDKGGFIADGGHSLKEKSSFLPSSVSPAKPPQLIGRYDFPDDWGVLLAIPNYEKNINGNSEVNIFQSACPVPKNEVEKTSHVIFMNIIPFLLERDIESFGKSIDKIQDIGFNKVELGLRPQKTLDLMDYMHEQGAYCVGMSSFGPTIYSFFDKNNKSIVKATKEYLAGDGVVISTKAQNHGYEMIK